MATPVSDYFAIGKNVYNPWTGITMNIAGYDFNPREPAWFWGGSNLITATTAVDTNLSSYKYGHEIMVGVSRISNPGPWDETVRPSIRFKDPSGNTLLWITTWTQTLAAWFYWGMYAYIGIDWDEITVNGTYTIEQYWDDTHMLSSTTITFTNCPTLTELTKSWALWVEGDNLCFVNKTTSGGWYKITIKNDGTNYGTATGKSGSIWIDSGYNWKISYVDASDVRRRTHAANDWAGTNTGWGTELPLSGKTAGGIWTSDNVNYSDGSYGYLSFIWNDGKGYRIMNWPV